MLYCKNCGKPLSGSKPFCRYCGARTSAPILGGKPPAPMNYEDTVPLDSTQFIKYSEQNKKKTGSMNTRVIIAVLCAAAAVMAAALMAIILTNKPSLPVNGEDGENISAYTDRIHTPMQTDDIKAPAVFTVEPTMQPVPPTPEPTPTGYVPEDMPRFADVWPEDYLEDFILQGYYRKYDISELYGFTQEEVEELLAYYGLSEQLEEVKKWYDGYLFNDFEIYNPWSILKYVNDRKDHVTEFALPYWSNTSSNSIVREMVGEADEMAKADLETLMAGGTIEKQVHEDITYGDIHQTQDNLWNFLFFTGYLKKVGERTVDNNLWLEMKIPNIEVATIYENSISYWFEQRMKETDRSPLKHALETGECEAVEDFINRQLADTISYYDYAENFYHGFMAGLLTNVGPYCVLSNRESGNGRPDIVMQTVQIRKGRVILLELKIAGSIAEMEAACDRGLAQIEAQRYAEPFTNEGYPEVKKYALSFYKKECMVKKAE